jgi:DNA-binding transcriptional ArsR family regulator
MHEMHAFGFLDRYGKTELYRDYEQVGADIEAFLKRSAPGVVALDFRGITFLGFSFAKATVGHALRLVSRGELEGVRVVAIAEEGLSLEELSVALERFDQALIVLAADSSDLTAGEIIGKLPEYLRSTWAVLAGLGPSTTADVADKIGESLQNTNQRLKKLSALGLIDREKVLSPSGGREWMNRVA